MITYTITINQVGDCVQIDVAAPPGKATLLEIEMARKLDKVILKFQSDAGHVMLVPPQRAGHSVGN